VTSQQFGKLVHLFTAIIVLKVISYQTVVSAIVRIFFSNRKQK